jgi:hypothetical protein
VCSGCAGSCHGRLAARQGHRFSGGLHGSRAGRRPGSRALA